MVRRIQVSKVISSRYSAWPTSPERPDSWDERMSGCDTVEAEGGEVIRLASSPMQSTPRPGWVILLSDGDSKSGFTWTLYGISPGH